MSRYIAILPLLFLVACSSNIKPSIQDNANLNGNINSQAKNKSENLNDLVHQFFVYEDEKGQDAWKKLQTYPRQELIDFLTQIQQKNLQNDSLRSEVAFVLCNMDYEYSANKEVIISTFKKSPEQADYLERPIDRLIRRGDKDLLSVLFEATTWSDGSLSEGIGDTFAEQIRTDLEKFLLELKTQNPKIRNRVYRLIYSSLSDEDLKQNKINLSKIPKTSPIAQISGEMLRAAAKY